jgi:hypothetical protein
MRGDEHDRQQCRHRHCLERGTFCFHGEVLADILTTTGEMMPELRAIFWGSGNVAGNFEPANRWDER